MEEAKSFIVTNWGDDGRLVINACEEFPKVNMTFKEFLNHCIACGGDWNNMILTGIKEIAPSVYEAIPEEMGKAAFGCICYVLRLIGVDTAA